MKTSASGNFSFTLRAFFIAEVQQTLEHHGCSSFLEPTHCIITMVFDFRSSFSITSSKSIWEITLSLLPNPYSPSLGLYSLPPVAIRTAPNLSSAPEILTVKLPSEPFIPWIFSPVLTSICSWDLTLSMRL